MPYVKARRMGTRAYARSHRNLVANGSFETDLTGVVERSGTSSDPVRDTDQFFDGAASVRQDLTTGTADGIYILVTTATQPGELYAAECWIRRGVYTGNNPRISLWDNVSGFTNGNAITATEEWQVSRVEKTFSTTSNERRVYIYTLSGDGTGTTGGSVWADAVRVY